MQREARRRIRTRRLQRVFLRAAWVAFLAAGVAYVVMRSDYDEVREEG